MKISIITPSFNHAEFIETTLQSVIRQDHAEVEHLVMDGGSKDGTVDILRRYPRIAWVSESDAGQSSAINKGFARATGDIVAWLNSDDYYEQNIFGGIARYFSEHPECNVLYGDISFVDRGGRLLHTITGDTIDYPRLIACPDIVRQPSFFWRRKVIEEVGGVDERLHLVMDFDFLLRVGKRHRFHYINRNLSYYRYYQDNKSLSQARRQSLEIVKVYVKNGVGINRHNARFLIGKFGRSFVLRPAKDCIRRVWRRSPESE